jgi:hypothetical protein
MTFEVNRYFLLLLEHQQRFAGVRELLALFGGGDSCCGGGTGELTNPIPLPPPAKPPMSSPSPTPPTAENKSDRGTVDLDTAFGVPTSAMFLASRWWTRRDSTGGGTSR